MFYVSSCYFHFACRKIAHIDECESALAKNAYLAVFLTGHHFSPASSLVLVNNDRNLLSFVGVRLQMFVKKSWITKDKENYFCIFDIEIRTDHNSFNEYFPIFFHAIINDYLCLLCVLQRFPLYATPIS